MVCPAANMTPIITQQILRQTKQTDTTKTASETASDSKYELPKLTPAENRREICNCVIAVLITIAIVIAIGLFF